MKNSKAVYPCEGKECWPLVSLSLRGWWQAVKIAFIPFLLSVIFFYLFSWIGIFVSSGIENYAIGFLGYLFVAFFLLGAFYFIHRRWAGDSFNFKQGMKVYVRRFFPALAALVIVFGVCFVLLFIGMLYSHYLTPYAHFLGNMGGSILIVVAALLGFIWFVITFYWFFYLVSEDIPFGEAFKKSLAANGLSKTAMTYLPVVGFFIIFILTNSNMPWMKMIDNVFFSFLLEFIIKLVLGAWVLNITCLMMNNLEYTVPGFRQYSEVDSDKVDQDIDPKQTDQGVESEQTDEDVESDKR